MSGAIITEDRLLFEVDVAQEFWNLKVNPANRLKFCIMCKKDFLSVSLDRARASTDHVFFFFVSGL